MRTSLFGKDVAMAVINLRAHLQGKNLAEEAMLHLR